VIGIEGEAGYMKLQGSAFDPLRSPTLSAVTPDVQGSAKAGDWYGMITGRLGYAWGTALLLRQGWRRLRARTGIGVRSMHKRRRGLRQLADFNLSVKNSYYRHGGWRHRMGIRGQLER
jgi:hypothetical protein